MITWHYLPVYVEHDGRIEFSICEVHLDDERLITAWTVDRAMAPSGESVEELRGDLECMLNDVGSLIKL